jgi:hypothetical protein
MQKFTLQVRKDGKNKLTVPQVEILNGFPTRDGAWFVSKAACETAGLDPRQFNHRAPTGETAHLYLRMGMNADGNELLDYEQVEAEARARYEAGRPAREAAALAAKQIKYAAQVSEARRTGKAVQIARWCETRRAREGGQWGDYTFVCTEFVRPDGTFGCTATNTY